MASTFETESANEMRLDAWMTSILPDNSLTLLHKGFSSLSLLYHWHQRGENRHWRLPLKKHTQYEVVHSLGRADELVMPRASPQGRKQWPDLPSEKMLSCSVGGKMRQVMTSLTDINRYRGSDVSELYRNSWKFELG